MGFASIIVVVVVLIKNWLGLEVNSWLGLLISSKVKVITSKFHFTACSSKKLFY